MNDTSIALDQLEKRLPDGVTVLQLLQVARRRSRGEHEYAAISVAITVEIGDIDNLKDAVRRMSAAVRKEYGR